jgi:hypothetical protein
MLYIGEGDPIADRLISHHKLKDFWSTAVFFNSKDDQLNKAHVQHLEARLVSLAKDAKRCVLQNANVPQRPALSERDTAGMEDFLQQMLLICGVLGINAFQMAAGVAPSTHLLHLKGKGLTGTGYETDDGFVVRAGSESPKDAAPTAPASVVRLRQALLSQGVFVDANDRYRLTQDYTFSSPSMASDVLLARSSNGRIEWKDDSGRTLKEIQDAVV